MYYICIYKCETQLCIMNPFSVKTYRGPAYFIDREKETAKLLDAIRNERNLTLFSHRRFGKTMLIHHVFTKLDHRGFQPVVVDIFATRNMVHFAQKLTEVLYERKIINESWLHKLLGSLGASMSFDPISGNPQISFSLVNRDRINQGLSDLFKQIVRTKKTVVIAFDEFQEVAKYTEPGFEKRLRSFIQQHSRICYIFSGSQKHLITEMFNANNRAFYKSAESFPLHRIETRNYIPWVQSLFSRKNVHLPAELIEEIVARFENHPMYIQNFLFPI